MTTHTITTEIDGHTKSIMFCDDDIDHAVIGREKMLMSIFEQNYSELFDHIVKDGR